jgi:hypothetical protein
MKTAEKIQSLASSTNEARTYTSEGRQTVANNCRELYNTIEKGLYEKYGQNAINDAYAELCEGNFEAPYMCEQKKSKFELYSTIYLDRVLKVKII